MSLALLIEVLYQLINVACIGFTDIWHTKIRAGNTCASFI